MKEKPRVPPDLADYVSHELRSPLNGIKIWAQVLSNGLEVNDEATVRRALAGIAEGVEKQARFLDSLLDDGPRHSPAHPGSNGDRPEDFMGDKRTHANEQDQQRNRTAEHPQRPDSQQETMEGPGGRHDGKAEGDATTRRGER